MPNTLGSIGENGAPEGYYFSRKNGDLMRRIKWSSRRRPPKTTTEGRDNQRSKVYRFGDTIEKRDTQTLSEKEIKPFIEKAIKWWYNIGKYNPRMGELWRAYKNSDDRYSGGLVRVGMPSVEITKRRVAARFIPNGSRYGHRIIIPTWAFNKTVVLHEVAHYIHFKEIGSIKYDTDPSHGPIFTRIWLDLVAHFMKSNRAELVRNAKAAKLKVAPRNLLPKYGKWDYYKPTTETREEWERHKGIHALRKK